MYAPKDTDHGALLFNKPLRVVHNVAEHGNEREEPAVEELKPVPGKPHLFVDIEGRLSYTPPLPPLPAPKVKRVRRPPSYTYALSHTVYRRDLNTDLVEYYEEDGRWTASKRTVKEFLKLPVLTLKEAQDAILKEEVLRRKAADKAAAADATKAKDKEEETEEEEKPKKPKKFKSKKERRVSTAGCLYRFVATEKVVEVLFEDEWVVSALPYEVFNSFRPAVAMESVLQKDCSNPGFVHDDRQGRVSEGGLLYRLGGNVGDVGGQLFYALGPNRWVVSSRDLQQFREYRPATKDEVAYFDGESA